MQLRLMIQLTWVILHCQVFLFHVFSGCRSLRFFFVSFISLQIEGFQEPNILSQNRLERGNSWHFNPTLLQFIYLIQKIKALCHVQRFYHISLFLSSSLKRNFDQKKNLSCPLVVELERIRIYRYINPSSLENVQNSSG